MHKKCKFLSIVSALFTIFFVPSSKAKDYKPEPTKNREDNAVMIYLPDANPDDIWLNIPLKSAFLVVSSNAGTSIKLSLRG